MDILEEKEDKNDFELYKKAIEEYRKNPRTYTIEEIKKELNQ